MSYQNHGSVAETPQQAAFDLVVEAQNAVIWPKNRITRRGISWDEHPDEYAHLKMLVRNNRAPNGRMRRGSIPIIAAEMTALAKFVDILGKPYIISPSAMHSMIFVMTNL